MMQGPQNPRMRGVQATTPRLGAMGPPRTVVAVTEAKYFAVGYHDENGVYQQALVLKIGEKVFFPPNVVEWARTLKPATTWFAEQFGRLAPAMTPVDPASLIPSSEPVDILGGEGNADPT